MIQILLRWAFAFVLLSLTYNPTSVNYIAWARGGYPDNLPIALLLGLILLAGYIVYLRATLRSIGIFGMVLVGAIVGALIWVLIDLGVLTLDNPSLNLWIGLFATSVVLGIGLSWSKIRRRLSGQTDVDDIDE